MRVPPWFQALLFGISFTATLSAQTTPGFVARADGAWIHYLEVGKSSSEPVHFLFVPGWMMPDWIWNPQLNDLRNEYRAVAMSPRSQGLSSKESDGLYPTARAADIKGVIDQLKLKPVILVAWSMAVAEAAAFVEEYGTKDLAGIVLIDGVAGIDGLAPLESSMGLVRGYSQQRPETTRRFVESMFQTPRTPEYLDRLTEAILQTPTNSALTLLLSSFAFDMRSSLSKIDVPTLIVASGPPDGPRMAGYRQMQESIPGARLESFAEAGHALFVDRASRFNQMLREFAGSLPRK